MSDTGTPTEHPSTQTQIEDNSNNNTLVAQSDYDAAMKAIESTFDNFQFQLPQAETENGEQQPQLDQERIDEIYKACKESLMRNIQRIVRPVADDDFQDYIDQYHYVQESIEDYEGEITKEEEELQMVIDQTIAEGEKDEEEIDEEELLDEKALKNAQTLRLRIREMSNTVQGVRNRIVQASEAGVSTTFEPQLVDKPVEIVDAEGEDAEDINETLQGSLQTLSQILQDPQWSKLPHRIQSLQDTIEAIQKETSDDRAMSQTERAILSQNDENQPSYKEPSFKLLEESTDGSDDHLVTAMDRLAMLGQCF